MKNVFFKLLLIFAFILNGFLYNSVFADNLGITSIIYDNSNSFLTINSQDNFDYPLTQAPKLNVIADENKAYFDLPNAVLKCPFQNLVIKSDEINEIVVSQFSTEPAIVRIVFRYNNGFNPYNIQLKKVNNTLFLKFNNISSNNYYFQGVYQEVPIAEFIETTSIKDKIKQPKNSILNQINSSFGSALSNDDKDFVLSDKNLILKSKYYVDDIIFKGSIPIITGVGSFTTVKPAYLSNPARAVFDIPNAIVNPTIRNDEINFGGAKTIKIGQFNKNTARIVIADNNPEKYIPVFYPDSQRLAFIDLKNISSSNLYRLTTDLVSVKSDSSDKQNYDIKFIFDKPLIFGLERIHSTAEMYFFNVNRYNANDVTSALKNTPFANVKISDLASGGIKISLTENEIENLNIHIGADGKTLRLRAKADKVTQKHEHKITVAPKQNNTDKINGKKYVVLDPGHGGSDVGATRNNIYEKNITLDVAKKVENLLIKKGYIVQMTRNDDSTVSLQARVEFSEEINPDIFVSIHVNSSNSDSPNGIETHYYKDNSLTLAKYVHASMLNNISAKDRGLFKSKFYVINHTTAPAILVEMGFISNPTERAQIVSETRKNATAKAIAEGIDEYFKQ